MTTTSDDTAQLNDILLSLAECSTAHTPQARVEQVFLGGVLTHPHLYEDACAVLGSSVELAYSEAAFRALHEELGKIAMSTAPAQRATVWPPALVATLPALHEKMPRFNWDGAVAAACAAWRQYQCAQAEEKSVADVLQGLARVLAQYAAHLGLEDFSGRVQQVLSDVALPVGARTAQIQKLASQLPTPGSSNTTTSIGDAVRATLEQAALNAQRNGEQTTQRVLHTGLSDLDGLIEGLEPGLMYILGGRPSQGKTALALGIADYVAGAHAQPQNVLIGSLEMSAESLGLRRVSALTGIDHRRIKQGDLSAKEWRELANAQAYFDELPIEVLDSTALTTGEAFCAEVRASHRKHPLSLVVLDYLQLLSTEGSGRRNTTRNEVVADLSRMMKKLAVELKIPMLILSQLSRELEKRPDRRPRMSDLRESGSLEQDADVVIFIYRDEVYNPKTAEPGLAELIVAKQRNGPTGTVKVGFNHAATSFYDLEY